MGDQGICIVPNAAGSYAVYLNKQSGKHMLDMMTGGEIVSLESVVQESIRRTFRSGGWPDARTDKLCST